jgi:hypothetical protein
MSVASSQSAVDVCVRRMINSQLGLQDDYLELWGK